MVFKKDEIIFLFGAGISADAGVPVSSQMVAQVEDLIKNNYEWSKFKDLYFLIKSGYEFSYGIQGIKPTFNIEALVNILTELEKKEMHPLYPFIGSWTIRFNEVIGNNFSLIGEFKSKIIEQLKSWVNPPDLRKSFYLKKLDELKDELKFPLRIFTLNYDLLIEKNLTNLDIERGFDEDTRKWNYKKFIERPEDPDIYLYKLHGSIDWERNTDTQIVTYSDSIPKQPDLIFGSQYKMQYVDPYLFLISEFRYYCLKAKLIVSLGYSFNDEHINSILTQAILSNDKLKLYVLAYKENEDRIKNILKINEERICIVTEKKANEFFNENLKLKTFKTLFSNEESNNIFFEEIKDSL